ncbi:histidine triad (HIT) protein [Alkaliphilus metalliredigens QYMF]|uniref:Histidine triad (HIT) protein n=1 Tax=Alkaliphilus metalliredigens (strain QYMF) TaxID=293826 RepID=A6TSL5_ALKMQ|nr:histidine triad nucleotide-binding protein [Alkaliphilus metalliredigens]ABR49183.1 histidine triad (HIT) protein [Alkaliphilus metalliredigens QYMF]
MECLFCKIVDQEIPATIIYENEDVMAFKDINPEAPVHLLVIPKKHIPSFAHLTQEDNEVLMPKIFVAIQHLAREFELEEEGFRVVNNCGTNGGQTVGHIHFHLMGGRRMVWPPG